MSGGGVAVECADATSTTDNPTVAGGYVTGPVVSLRPAQGVVFNDPARFRLLVAGRRFGKTYLAVVVLAARAGAQPGGTFWYMAPTYSQAKDLAWSLLKKVIPAAWVAKKNESELRLELVNGSVIELKGSENADSLRGRSLSGVVMDEAAVMKRHVWFEVVRPSLADQQGWSLFITTPKGTSSWFYEVYLAAGGRRDLLDDPDALGSADDWSVYTFTTLEGGNVPPLEVEAARRELDARTFRQEFEASFEALAGLICVSFSNDNISSMVSDDPELPLWVGLDFNVDPLAAVCGVKKTVSREWVDDMGVPHVEKTQFVHIFAEIALHGGATTWDMADAIYEKFGMERRIEVMPDPTGIRLQTSGIGISDHRILRKCGLKVVAPTRPWVVKDKINALNSGFQTGDGTHHVFIHPRCRRLINGLRSWTYEDGKNTPDKKLGNDHFPDALGYLLLAKFNLAAKALRRGDPYRTW